MEADPQRGPTMKRIRMHVDGSRHLAVSAKRLHAKPHNPDEGAAILRALVQKQTSGSEPH